MTKGDKVLVIAAIDGTTLSNVLKKATDTGITVIAYDRLILDSPNVDYYATFDNFKVGVLQATSIEQASASTRARTVRSTSNCSAVRRTTPTRYFFYNGAMSVLQPYIDSGKLVVAVEPDRHGQGRNPPLEGRNGAGAHGQPPQRQLHQKRVDAVCRPMTV